MQVYPINFNSKVLRTDNKLNVSFRGTLYEDDIMEGSIFDLQNKIERERNVGDVNAFIDYWAAQKNFGTPVKDSDMKNWEIKSFRDLENNTYKGGMHEACNYIDKFKEKGIRKFIVLCQEYDLPMQNKLKEAGMDYESFFVPMQPVLSPDMKESIMSRFNVNSFVGTLLDLRNGNVFIGCENGNLRTARMLTVFRRLDPSSKLYKEQELLTKGPAGHEQFAQWIYEAMTDVQKAKLGYTPEFEAKLKELFSNIDFMLYLSRKR